MHRRTSGVALTLYALVFAFAFACVLAPPAPAHEPPTFADLPLPAKLLNNHGGSIDEVDPASTTTALGLFLVGTDDSYLANVPIKITKLSPAESKDTDDTRRLRVVSEDAPALLLVGRHHLAEGIIRTLIWTRRKLLPEKPIAVSIEGRRYQIALRPPAPVPSDPDIPHHLHITLSHGRIHQDLGHFVTSIQQAYVVWAGDLDGDGKLDILLSDQYVSGSSLVLYLSSLAFNGELVRPVAKDGFSCGC